MKGKEDGRFSKNLMKGELKEGSQQHSTTKTKTRKNLMKGELKGDAEEA